MALDLLDEAERYLPDDPNIPRYRGFCEEARDDLDRAVAAYEQAVAMDPSHLPSLTSLAWAQLKQGHSDLAEETLGRARKVESDDPYVLYFVGLVHFTLGRQAEAETAWIHAAELAPHIARVHQNLGALYLIQEKFPEAERSLRQAIDVDPALAGARTDLGILLMLQGQTGAAIENLETAVALDRMDRRASKFLARLLTEQGHLERAREIAQEADDLVTSRVSVPESVSSEGEPSSPNP